MAHKKDGEMFLVDWKTGDPESDRAYLFRAYRNFLRELNAFLIESENFEAIEIFEKWGIQELDIDDFPRIAIEYPHDFPENLK